MALGLVAAGIILCSNGHATAQQKFDEASIKRSRDARSVVPGIFLPNGQWSAQNATLAMLLRSAYDIDRFVGMPDWAQSERFDVVTTASPNTTPAQLRAMARALLVARFELRTRIEQRTSEVFVLVRAKEGVLGPGLRSATIECPRGAAAADAAGDATRSKQCSEVIARADSGAFRFQLRDRPLRDLLIISGARSELGDPIIDRTGLVGRFDIDFEFASREARERTRDGLGLPYDAAFERHLGLRFEQRREPIDVLVVEHIALPSPD